MHVPDAVYAEFEELAKSSPLSARALMAEVLKRYLEEKEAKCP